MVRLSAEKTRARFERPELRRATPGQHAVWEAGLAAPTRKQITKAKDGREQHLVKRGGYPLAPDHQSPGYGQGVRDLAQGRAPDLLIALDYLRPPAVGLIESGLCVREHNSIVRLRC